MQRATGFILFLFFLLSCGNYYTAQQIIPISVDALSSKRTQLPIDFYSLPFCPPADLTYEARTFGEALLGTTKASSIYKIRMLESATCVELGKTEKVHPLPWGKGNLNSSNAGVLPDSCKREYNFLELQAFMKAIKSEYKINWAFDGMPMMTDKFNSLSGNNYTMGVPIGYIDYKGDFLLNNHLDISIHYTQTDETRYNDPNDPLTPITYHVLGFVVVGDSRDYHGEDPELVQCKPAGKLQINGKNSLEIPWTYTVNWVKKDIEFSDRYNRFLRSMNPEISSYSIINNAVIILALAAVLISIIISVTKTDSKTYNEKEQERIRDEEAAIEEGTELLNENGWKVLARDVFRTPDFSSLLAMLCGEGARFVASIAVLIIISFPNFSRLSKESFVQNFMIVYGISAVVSGFVSTTFFKIFNSDTRSLKPLSVNEKYAEEGTISNVLEFSVITSSLSALTPTQRQAALSAFIVPISIILAYIVLDFGLWVNDSTAFSIFPVVCLILIALFLAIPLSLVGSYLAAKNRFLPFTLASSSVARPIPPKPIQSMWSTHAAIAGLTIFGGCFVQFYYLLNAIWEHKYYSVAGLSFSVFLTVFILTVLLSIIMIYYQLCNEDHKWWWHAFFIGAASGFFFLLYSLYYATVRLNIITLFSLVFFFIFSALTSFVISIFAGSVAMIAAYIFIRCIYSTTKYE